LNYTLIATQIEFYEALLQSSWKTSRFQTEPLLTRRLLTQVAPKLSNILIRGTNWIGDAVMSIPALRELRSLFPQARLTLLVKPWVRDIFLDAHFIDDLMVYDDSAAGRVRGFLRTAGELRRRRFDTAILFQGAFGAAALASLARIPTRIGFPSDGRRFLLTHPLQWDDQIRAGHEVFYYLNIVSQISELFLGADKVNFLTPRYRLEISEERRQAARQLLRESGANGQKPLVVINPGATNSRAKRWLPERFAALADCFVERGCVVAFIGAASENGIADEIIRRMRQQAVRLTGRISLAELIGVLSLCNLLVSNDTGPAYISAALDRPTLTIFGPTNLWSTSPISPRSHILYHPVECSPCMLRDCPIDHRCMTGITVEAVYQKAVELLGSP
jgi:heptosyltransferase II